MKRKRISLYMMGVLLSASLLAGCGSADKKPVVDDTTVEESKEEKENGSGFLEELKDTIAEAKDKDSEGSEETSGDKEVAEGEGKDSQDEPSDDGDKKAALAEKKRLRIRHKYADILSGIYAAMMLPDGTSLYYDTYPEADTFQYAIMDVDGDGMEELIFEYSGTCMADMVEYIWGYDPDTDTLSEELCEFPGVEPYEDGYLLAMASHNHSMGLDYWPYTLYSYDPDANTYTQEAEVSAWQKEYFEVSYMDEPFPDDVDEDGNGVVFCVSSKEYETVDYIDDAAYEEWKNSLYGEKKPLELTTKTVAYEEIRALEEPYINSLFEKIENTGKGTDLGMFYIQNGENELKAKLENEYGVAFAYTDEWEMESVGTINGVNSVSLFYEDGGSFEYTSQIEDITVLGLYPGMNESAAFARLTDIGFYPLDDNTNLYLTGLGFGNYGVYIETEGGKVTSISIFDYCQYVG